MKEAVLGLLRHLLTFGGGVFVSNGWLTEADLTTAVAAFATIVGLGWSMFDKWKRSQEEAATVE